LVGKNGRLFTFTASVQEYSTHELTFWMSFKIVVVPRGLGFVMREHFLAQLKYHFFNDKLSLDELLES
jgi:hypothetical protein